MSVDLPDGLLEAGPPPALVVGRCRSCGARHFPRSEACPYCAAEDVEDGRLTGPGRLWAWTAVTSAPPGYGGPVPYGFGVVEFPEGLRVVGRLTEADPARLEAGQAVHLVVDAVPTADGGTLGVWAFSPDGPPS